MPNIKKGWLVWRSHMIEWQYMTFKSTKDLTLHPHFEITARNRMSGESVTFDDVQVKGELRNISDLSKLPGKERDFILDSACDVLEGKLAEVKV